MRAKSKQGGLVLSRKPGETVRVLHAGEELLIVVRGATCQLQFVGPRAFVVSRCDRADQGGQPR